MLRNFRFAAEKQFTRNQLGILYFLVNTLIDNIGTILRKSYKISIF